MRVWFVVLILGGMHPVIASVEKRLADEAGRRETVLQPLQEATRKAESLAAQGELDKASQGLRQAYEETPESLRNTPPGQKARALLVRLWIRMGKAAAENSAWPEVRDKALAVLQLEPNNSAAGDLLARSEEILRRGARPGEEVNPALTPRFFDRLQGVTSGLKEAEQYRETGQLDLAETRYEEVLRLDPFNGPATEGIQKIYKERALVSEKTRDLSNLQFRREIREAWNNILPRKEKDTGGIEVAGPITASQTFQLEQKLRTIVIPSIDFNGADLETIKKSLTALSRQYDPDPAKTGVNFVVSSDVGESQLVNLQLRQTSLGDVVRYVALLAGVKARFRDEGVIFGPVVEKAPDLILRTFTVSPSFFKTPGPTGNAETGGAPRGGGGGGRETENGEVQLSEQAKLEALGVKFPKDAYAVYSRNTSQLKVYNNAEMLDFIGQLISAAEEETLLIQVGVKLIEINQVDLDSITVNSTLGGNGLNLLSPIPVGLGTNTTGVTPAASSQQGVTAQLNQIQGVGMLPNNTLQSFLQPNVLAGTNQISSYALNTMELGGTIMGGTQFRTLITAVSQKSSANVLASPTIVLKRGQEGVIEVTQEFRFVQEYNDPQSSIRTFTPVAIVGNNNNNQLSSVPGPETVISSFPSQISDPVPIGVKMGVKPDVTGDNSRVLLELKPSFVDFEGFINYGTPINSAYAASYYNTQVTILTNTVQQPVFVRRDLTLPAVEVNDGYTLLLGGLLREDIQKVDEKVPLLGDIPLLGRAFQGKTEQAIKKNTLIFVTPRILRVDGQPLNPTAGSATTASTGGSP